MNPRTRTPSHAAKAFRVRAGIALATGLVVLLTVDPFGLSLIPATLARSAETQEDRAQNLATAIEALPASELHDLDPVAGQWADPVLADTSLQPAQLPSADEQTVDVPETGEAAVDLGGMSVAVAAAEDAVTPESVTLRVADPADAAAVGVTGVLLDVIDSSEVPGSAPAEDLQVDLRLSYGAFAEAAGGDWASRLQIQYLPECYEVTPDVVECQPVALESVNDTGSQTLTAQVPVEPSDGAPAAARTSSAARMATTGGGGRIAVSAGASGPMGDWTATSLAPSSSWATSGSTGAFTWSYPIEVPTPASGPAPELTLSYSSAVADGRIPTANNQSGWIGEGFDLATGYIERSYKSCEDDKTAGSNNHGRDSLDLCWGPSNATMMFRGASTPLVEGDGNRWYSMNDDGTRVDRIPAVEGGAREQWKVTTTDGVQYFFGTSDTSAWTVPVFGNDATDPCYKNAAQGGFNKSRCDQVWRWNLDKVLDPSGNTMTFSYVTERNYYIPDWFGNTSRTAVPYVSGGHLTAITYGTRDGDTGTTPYQVKFDTAPRCVTQADSGTSQCGAGQSNPNALTWPDTPRDLLCTQAANCKNYSPVFFDTTRLAKITAQSREGSSWRPISSWALTHAYVREGGGTDIANASSRTLLLTDVVRTGHGISANVADITLPPIKFGYTAYENRVDTVTDGYPAMWRSRITTVLTDTRGRVSVNYQLPDPACAAAVLPTQPSTEQQSSNTRACYPVKWQPPRETAHRVSWFHKYLVASLVEDGAPGNGNDLNTRSVSKETHYTYGGGAYWAKPKGPLVDQNTVTYSEFRGYAQVDTVDGTDAEATSAQRTTYYRGTGATLTGGNGNTVSVTDREPFAGQVFAQTTMNGATKVSETVAEPGVPTTVADDPGDLKSTRISKTTTHGYSYNAQGNLQYRTRSTTDTNEFGQPVTISNLGDVNEDGDDTCTTTTYENASAFSAPNMQSYPTSTKVTSAACGEQGELLTHDKATYNNRGLVLTSQSLNGAGNGFITDATYTYNDRGLILTSEDAAGGVTSTAYAYATAGQVREITTTLPAVPGKPAFRTVRAVDPLTGIVTLERDVNGKETSGTFDALGRTTSVTLPQHQGTGQASARYEYVAAGNGLNAVITRTLNAAGTGYHAAAQLYDGMLRPFQTQTEGSNATSGDRGRNITQTIYDSAGRVIRAEGTWWTAGAVSATPVNTATVAPAITEYRYDKAGRVVSEALFNGTQANPDHKLWETTTDYDGATTLTIPPVGGVPTAHTNDALGRLIEQTEYQRDPDTAAGVVDAPGVKALPSHVTKYRYDHAGQLTGIVDPGQSGQAVSRSYEYDKRSQQISATDPDNGTTTTEYDVLGQATAKTNANDDTTAYTYDPLGRPLTMRDTSAGAGVGASWTYDDSVDEDGNRVLGAVTNATRTTADNLTYTTTVSKYDDAGRPTQVDTKLPTHPSLRGLSGKTYSTSFGFTADGQMEQLTLPAITTADGATVLGKETVTTHFDDASKPSWMGGGFGWGTYVAESVWDERGRPLAFDLGNTYGAAVTYRWDVATGRLMRTALDRERVSGTEVELNWSYDNAGNVTRLTDTPSNTLVASQTDDQCFNYDGLRRLTQAWATGTGNCAIPANGLSAASIGGIDPYAETFAYDVAGNRTTRTAISGSGATTTTAYTYGASSASNHRLTRAVTTAGSAEPATTTYGWDAAGNQTTRTSGDVTAQLTWDAEGELVGFDDGASTESNVYDADGSRIVRFETESVTVFLPGGQEVTATSAGVTASRWYTFGDTTVAVRTSGGLGGVISVMTDHHGSIIATVQNTNWPAGVIRHRPSPFGTARDGGTADTTEGRGFLGAVQDASGLVLLSARYYDPAAGTFVSVDPVLDPTNSAQLNAYNYAGNNPLTWSDPTGLDFRMDRASGSTGTLDISHCGSLGARSGAQCSIKSSVRQVGTQGTKPSPEVQTAVPNSDCKTGDWSCRVQAAIDAPDCGGAGKFRRCNSEPGAGIFNYSYSYDHFVTNRKGMTPKRVMDIFKANAQTVFPFKVEGCEEFTNGAECELRTGTPLLNPNGVVGVTTTDTAVKFTVIERGYFDAPGSTIEFSVSQQKDGVYLTQTAHASGADVFTWAGVGPARAALPTWEEQARRLTGLVEAD